MRPGAFAVTSAFLLVASAVPGLGQGQPLPGQRGGPPLPQQQQPQRGQQQPAPPPGARQQQAQQPPAAAPAPYQPVTFTAPTPVNDPGLNAFRSQLGEIAKRKDRRALAALIVPQGFFWLGEKGDRADKRKPAIESLAKAMALDAKDGSGWEALAGYAADPTAMAVPDRKDTMCAPADPVFDTKALEALAKATGTDPSDWGYPMQPDVEVRGGPQPNAPVIEKLGMHFVRVMEEPGAPNQPQSPMLRIITPSGKMGFVQGEAISPLGNDQLCYAKDAAGAWKIAGFVGGDQ